MTASASRHLPGSTGATSRTSSSLMQFRSGGRRAMNRWRRPRWPRMASSTSPTAGASSTRSMAPPAMSAASSGVWIPSRRSSPIIVARCFGAISSFRPPTGRRASLRPTRRPARSCGKLTCPSGWHSCASPQPRSRSRTRSSSEHRAATAEYATGSRASMRPQARSCGASSPFRRPASPAARPGRTTTMPGRPAAAPSG